MSSNEVSVRENGVDAAGVLGWAARFWFVVAAVGQGAFIYFIVAFYGTRAASGHFAAWNDKPLITGYVKGDSAGNAMFAAHVLLAAIVTLAGLAQLVPALRRAAPALHRWSGRVFLTTACVTAVSGLWMTLARGSYLSLVSAVAIGLDAVLILVFAGLAWREALVRRFERHRRWAMRTFMAVSGVWFLRVGLMGWVVLNGRPVGMTSKMTGPADIVLAFGSYLIPLAILELYFAAERSAKPAPKLAAAGVILVSTAYVAAGVFGAVAMMWGPYL
ncbi:DUF2306 domain-containing protein [Caulobacter sp. CCH9-E1]|uniref:DUF2306 domain-containing protein n=1 Tax=Caulobacter sp. CCH9-E1 TaxID=1768768 RepID=UPI0008297AA8|nr:DUF2306 domain-containing protein [Caulobacter sp. CCH9-E1]